MMTLNVFLAHIDHYVTFSYKKKKKNEVTGEVELLFFIIKIMILIVMKIAH